MQRPESSGRPLTVSVVIPVKDDAAHLRRCLSALERQTLRPEEIIVVDNGSSDSSAAVAARAGARVVRCEQPGIPAASATGYDAASGDVILRLDADCLPADTWVKVMTDAFARHPRVSVYTSGARFVDGPGWLRTPLATVYLLAYAALSATALGHLPVFGSNLGFRRTAWLAVRADVHRDDPELHDDLDLAFHFGERHRIRILRHAAMGMSMRPFASGRGFGRRVTRGFRSVTVHWPHDFPPMRWARLVRRRIPLRTAPTSASATLSRAREPFDPRRRPDRRPAAADRAGDRPRR